MLRAANPKQREAYARYCHTSSAAALIGTATLVFSEIPLTSSIAARAILMFILGVGLLTFGTFLLREA